MAQRPEPLAVVDVHDADLLVGLDIRRVHQRLVNRQRPLVVKVRLRYHRPVNF